MLRINYFSYIDFFSFLGSAQNKIQTTIQLYSLIVNRIQWDKFFFFFVYLFDLQHEDNTYSSTSSILIWHNTKKIPQTLIILAELS